MEKLLQGHTAAARPSRSPRRLQHARLLHRRGRRQPARIASSTSTMTASSSRCASTTGSSCSWSSAPDSWPVWAEPFVELRVPKIFNLRRDPFERADENSNTYWDWLLDHAFLLVPAQADVAQALQEFAEFPPRQKPASFNLDRVLDKLHGRGRRPAVRDIRSLSCTTLRPRLPRHGQTHRRALQPELRLLLFPEKGRLYPDSDSACRTRRWSATSADHRGASGAAGDHRLAGGGADPDGPRLLPPGSWQWNRNTCPPACASNTPCRPTASCSTTIGAAFFTRTGFFVGLSIDGPRASTTPIAATGQGIRSSTTSSGPPGCCRRHDVEFNILCTVNAANASSRSRSTGFSGTSCGARYLQFIPIVEMNNDTGDQSGTRSPTARSVRSSTAGS